jgi:HAD superfamily hydrolase (TIGR01509 family)
MRFADVDAVTVDGFGTLVRLVDPVPALGRALHDRGFERTTDQVRAAFVAEVSYYKPRALTGRDADTLAALRVDCARVFVEAADAEIPAESFVDAFMTSIVLQPIPGALETVADLRRRGIEVAVVSNWDIGLAELLEQIGAAQLFTAIVTTAEANAPKPNSAVFRLALDRLAVQPERAVHVGDEDEDEQGALAAGMLFAPAPLPSAFESWS